MKIFKLWHDGKCIEVFLSEPPIIGDVINHEGVEYTVGGRRFEDSKLHYAVTSPMKSVYEDPNYRSPL